MLRSENQYLRPEYLTPLPTTLDAKKSPLALLAQTCSQIGADSPSKSLLASLDKPSKSSKSDHSREKSSPSTLDTTKANFKPYESCLTKEKSSSPELQRSGSTHSGRSRTPGKRCPSNQSVSSIRAMTPQGRKTATPTGEVRDSSSRTSTHEPSQAPISSPKTSYSPTSILLTDPSIKDLPLGTFKPGVSLPSSSYLSYPQIDAMTSLALKNGLSPYYARKSTEPGLMPPVCRDPYCTGCHLNSHIYNGKSPSDSSCSVPCNAGCAQCDHELTSSSTGAVYAHAQLAALTVSQLPYVCNWIAGDTAYCGKRFASSEELLQHLRTHTTTMTDPTAMSLMAPSVGLPTHPLFARTYTPPLSPLATARYHPYGKPPLLPTSIATLGLPLPPPPPSVGLPPYFSPYALYAAPRLGASSGLPQ